ncbi:MAG: pyridoxal-dependent decarboxylase, exosortase A system-associated [Gammaproteobacteria bacterium]|nr:pyridoxal-dependent decarboxylase, exosortase A system-associated [Gammaproteobacteria bacterium]
MSVPVHTPMTQFQVIDDCLQIAGIPLTEVVKKTGMTPFYAYDSNLISQRIKYLKKILPADIHLHYAIKANPMQEVVSHVASMVDGLDVASGGELEIALASGMAPGKISFAGPGKTEKELTSAIQAGITLNMESENEMMTISRLGKELKLTPKVAIRVNPDFELKTSGMKMGGGPKQFGIDAESVPDLLPKISPAGLDFQGFHIFSGSQNLRAEAICETHDKTFELALSLCKKLSTPLKTLNIGGGFGIPYFPGETPLDVEKVCDNLKKLLPDVRKKLPDTEIIIELGRYLVGEAGIYVSKVIDRKISRGQVFLVTDGGLHHHLAASGNFGQFIRKNYPVAVGNKMKGAEREIVNVVGPLCTPMDILADKMEMAKAEPGDMIVVFQSGAYGLTASPTAFLSHPAPAEIFL